MDYSQSPQLCRTLQLRVRRPCWPCSPPGCRAQPLDFWHLPEKRTVVCTGFPLPLIWSRGAPNKPAGAVLCAACNGLVNALNFTELDQSCLECDRNGQASCTAPRAALAQCRDLLTQPRSLQQHTHTPRLWTFLATTSPPPAPSCCQVLTSALDWPSAAICLARPACLRIAPLRQSEPCPGLCRLSGLSTRFPLCLMPVVSHLSTGVCSVAPVSNLPSVFFRS